MPNLNETARRIREDAERSCFKMGEKSTRRLICLIEAMAAEVEALKANAREKAKPAAGLPSRRVDWHYDSQGYCDNPGRGY